MVNLHKKSHKNAFTSGSKRANSPGLNPWKHWVNWAQTSCSRALFSSRASNWLILSTLSVHSAFSSLEAMPLWRSLGRSTIRNHHWLSSFSELSKMLSPGLQSSFCPELNSPQHKKKTSSNSCNLVLSSQLRAAKLWHTRDNGQRRQAFCEILASH